MVVYNVSEIWQESNFLQIINILSGMRLMRSLLRIYRAHKNYMLPTCSMRKHLINAENLNFDI